MGEFLPEIDEIERQNSSYAPDVIKATLLTSLNLPGTLFGKRKMRFAVLKDLWLSTENRALSGN